MKKNRYLMYTEWSKMFLDLDAEKAGTLLHAICAYHEGMEYEISDPVLSAIFSMIKSTFENDAAAYDEKCERNRQNIKKRYTTVDEPTTTVYDRIRTNSDNDNDIDKIDIKEKESIKKKKVARFAPPSLHEVKEYCEERKNSVNPQQFIDFYTSKNWMIGKNKMRDWKAALRTWEQRGRASPNAFNRIQNNSYDFDDLERRLTSG